MSIYERFGVRTRINAAGLLTRLGGSLMPAEVLDAMTEAAGSFVDMAELQAAASAVIARHTGAEAGLVTSGGRGRAHGRDGGLPRRTGCRAHGPTPRDGRLPERGRDVSDAPDRLRPCHPGGRRPDPRGGVQRPGDGRRGAGRGGVGAGGGHHAAHGGHRLHGRTGESAPPCRSGRPGAPPSPAGAWWTPPPSCRRRRTSAASWRTAPTWLPSAGERRSGVRRARAFSAVAGTSSGPPRSSSSTWMFGLRPGDRRRIFSLGCRSGGFPTTGSGAGAR